MRSRVRNRIFFVLLFTRKICGNVVHCKNVRLQVRKVCIFGHILTSNLCQCLLKNERVDVGYWGRNVPWWALMCCVLPYHSISAKKHHWIGNMDWRWSEQEGMRVAGESEPENKNKFFFSERDGANPSCRESMPCTKDARSVSKPRWPWRARRRYIDTWSISYEAH